MKYCSHCGAQIDDQAVICVKCGCAVVAHTTAVDESSTGLNVISFLFPIIGLVLYIIYHEKSPIKAKGIGKWALISFIIGLIPILLMVILEATIW